MKTLLHVCIDKEQEPAIITTTLYDLIEAINSEVSSEEAEALVIATVMALLRSGRIRFLSAQDHYN